MRTAPKKEFLDEVVEDMGDGDEAIYGAEMEEEGDDETAKEDRIMAVKQLGKALGVNIADPERAADALATFIQSC
jgi:hypothetical protein